MDSRIILTQADFSANNIGQYVELSDLTKKVLAKQTQYGEDSTEAIALNNFLNSLISEGFIGGETPLLGDLIIPALAASHDEMLYDIAHLDGNGYPTNLMATEEIEATTANKTYRPVVSDGKVVAVQRYADSSMPAESNLRAQVRMNNYAFQEMNTAGQNLASFSILLYIHKLGSSSSSSYFSTSGGSYSTGSFTVKKTKTILKPGSTDLVSVDYTSLGKFNVIGYDKQNVKFDATIDGVTITGSAGTETSYDDAMGMFELGSYAYNYKPEFSFIAMGKYLTSAQRATLKGYVETFLTAIHANI